MNPRLEKVMVVLGIVGAVILVIAICFIVGKTIGVFGNGSNDKQTDSVVATESQSESESEDVVMIDVKGMTQAQAESMLKEKNISKNKLCEACNLQRTQLNNYCKNKVTRIDFTILAKLCEFLDCTPNDILKLK